MSNIHVYLIILISSNFYYHYHSQPIPSLSYTVLPDSSSCPGLSDVFYISSTLSASAFPSSKNLSFLTIPTHYLGLSCLI